MMTLHNAIHLLLSSQGGETGGPGTAGECVATTGGSCFEFGIVFLFKDGNSLGLAGGSCALSPGGGRFEFGS